MKLPAKYAYLESGDMPATIREAVKLFGVRETPGAADNATILAWAKEVEHAIGVAHLGYTADSIPWCGLFAGIVCVRAKWADQMPKTPLWARSWIEFGQKSPKPGIGDIMVFSRDGGGHVGFYVGEDMTYYHIIGGNQSDAVTITRVAKGRLLGARRPKWRIAQPASVKTVLVGATGPISKNEA